MVRLLGRVGLLCGVAWWGAAIASAEEPPGFTVRPVGRTILNSPSFPWRAVMEDSRLYLMENRFEPKQKELLAVETGVPKCWTFSPDGRYLVIGCSYKKQEDNFGFIEVWDVAARKRVSRIGKAEGRGAFGSVTHVGFGEQDTEIVYTAEPYRIDGK